MKLHYLFVKLKLLRIAVVASTGEFIGFIHKKDFLS